MKRTNASVRDQNICSYAAAGSAHFWAGESNICHNTHLRAATKESSPPIEVIFHRTPIVTFFPNGVIRLATGGWRTATTKQRLNLFSPYHIYAEKREWFVRTTFGTFPFVEDMEIHKGALTSIVRA